MAMREYYKVTELEKNVFRLYSDEGVHSDLFVGQDKALLLDTGYGFGDLHAAVKGITGNSKSLMIVNSHAHIDHASGNFQFDEGIFLHPKDWELYERITSAEKRRYNVEQGRRTPKFQDGEEGVHNILPQDFDEERYIYGRNDRLIPVKEGDTFDLGGINLTVVETPGHTKGSISLIYEQKKWLFAGDAMNMFMLLFKEESTNLSEYIHTLKKAEALRLEKLVIVICKEKIDI